MSRRGLHDLIQMKPKKRFDPRKCKIREDGSAGFETLTRAVDEDEVRVSVLRRTAKRLGDASERKRVRALAKRLDGTGVPDTLASYRRFREVRASLVSYFWSLLVSTPEKPKGTATILVKGWKIPSADLHLCNPKKMLESFRADLNRAGLPKASGFAFFGLHGEYDPATDCFDIHIHGIYAGEVWAVVEKLKARPKYASFRARVGEAEKTVCRVFVTKRGLTDLPRPISYIIQSWWPQRETILDLHTSARSPIRKRMPDRPHVEWLKWMDRWDITDLTLMIGLRVTKNGFEVREKRTAIADDIDRD